MFRKNHNAGANRTNLYDDMTGKIIAKLEAGRTPWFQPWGSAAAKAPLLHAEERCHHGDIRASMC